MPLPVVAGTRKAILAGVILSLALGILVGLAVAGHGVYMAAKSSLAQMLLENAWERTLVTGISHRPWFWADTHPLARLIAPDHGVEEIVLAGSSGRTLAFGPGHVEGTAAPGDNGLSIISGHRDSHFSFLENLRAGDELFIETASATHRYVVHHTLVIDLQREDFSADPVADQLMLVTCYPFHQWTAGGTQRYVVVADHVRGQGV